MTSRSEHRVVLDGVTHGVNMDGSHSRTWCGLPYAVRWCYAIGSVVPDIDCMACVAVEAARAR